MRVEETRKIFLCYRRDDAGGDTGRLSDRLVREFGDDSIFMDVDGIRLGTNFVKRLTAEVQSCDVLLAVIGPNWLDARDEEGHRRLDNPHDFVRIEIGAALQRDIPVIPILLNGTKIPRADRLPPELQELTLRSALDVRLGSFHSDVARLIAALKQSPSTEPPSDQETYPKLEEFVWARKANPVKKVQAETWLQIILFGIAGALVASWLLPVLGIGLGNRSSGFFNATLGAVIGLVIFWLIKRA
jgi:uncharacterized membrane protein YeaQ/YmgE (transglycosylase-associated protein family)